MNTTIDDSSVNHAIELVTQADVCRQYLPARSAGKPKHKLKFNLETPSLL